jgi:hypothetical protein
MKVVENQNTHFMFANFFQKFVPFMRRCRKIWWSQRGHKWRHNIAHTRCMLDKQDYMYTRAFIRPRAQAPMHAHTDKYVILNFFSTAKMIRQRASVLRYTYVVCLVSLHQRSTLILAIVLLFSERQAERSHENCKQSNASPEVLTTGKNTLLFLKFKRCKEIFCPTQSVLISTKKLMNLTSRTINLFNFMSSL